MDVCEFICWQSWGEDEFNGCWTTTFVKYKCMKSRCEYKAWLWVQLASYNQSISLRLALWPAICPVIVAEMDSVITEHSRNDHMVRVSSKIHVLHEILDVKVM